MNPPQVVQNSVVVQNSFQGGINTAVPPELIQESEAVDILNFEYSFEDHLVSRAGVRQIYSTKFPSKITSLHSYGNDAGDEFIISTSGKKLYVADTDGTSFTDITGSLVLPNNTNWQWVNFTGYAIGVNKAKTGDNPVKVYGATPTVAALGGTPPKANYVALWNERLWVSGAIERNTIYGSKLGNPEDWVDTGADGAVAIDLGKNDGDEITGLQVFEGSLFVFKRRKIYRIGAVSGTSAYNAANLEATVYSENIGCLSGHTIKPILNDVLFLSDTGVCSLVAAPLGNVKTQVISQKVKELSGLRKASDEIVAHVCEIASQYWLMIPATASSRGLFEIFVFDYQNIQNGIARWIRFDGKVAGTCATTAIINGQRIELIGSNDLKVYSYIPGKYDYSAVYGVGVFGVSVFGKQEDFYFDDGGIPYRKYLRTRAFNFGLPLIRKQFNRLGWNITLLSNDLKLEVKYFYDKIESKGGQYVLNYAKQVTEALYGTAIYGLSVFGRQVKKDFSVIRRVLLNTEGRKSQNISIEFENKRKEGFVIREVAIEVAPLNSKQVNELNIIP